MRGGRTVGIVGLMLFCSSTFLNAQTPTLKVLWEIEGPVGPTGGPRPQFTVAIAQTYGYKLYKVSDPGSGTTLTGVTCTTTNDPYVKSCIGPVPSTFDIPGLILDLTCVVNGIESPHSNQAMVPPPAQPNTAPINTRLQRQVWNFIKQIGTIPVSATRTLFVEPKKSTPSFRLLVPVEQGVTGSLSTSSYRDPADR
jgi:hypothetical protein